MVAEFGAQLDGILVKTDLGAPAEVERIGLPVGVLHPGGGGIRARQGAVKRVEARDRLDPAAWRQLHWHRQIEGDAIFEVLVIEAECRAVPATLRCQPELAALVGGVARRAQAVVGAVEATGGHAPVIDGRAAPSVDAAIIAVTALHAHTQFRMIRRGARNEVDQAAQGIGSEDRRWSAAHHLYGLKRVVDAERLVGIEIAEAGIVLDGQAVLEDCQRGKAVAGDAAGADIVGGLAA